MKSTETIHRGCLLVLGATLVFAARARRPPSRIRSRLGMRLHQGPGQTNQSRLRYGLRESRLAAGYS